MNKVTKGTLAAAAAGALLLGGAGTYATWSDSKTLNAGNLSTGVLTLEQASTDGWSYDPTGAPVWDDPSTVGVVDTPVIVPGDELTAVYNITVRASGDKIAGDLTLKETTEVGLPTGVTVHIVASSFSDKLTPNGATISFSEKGTYTFKATVTLRFAADFQTSQGEDVLLDGLQVQLSQKRA